MTVKFASLAAAAALAFALPAANAQASTVPTSCQSYGTTVVNGAINCAGFYSGNVFSGNATNVATQQAAVSYLGGSFDGNWGAVPSTTSLTGGNMISFGQTLYGQNIVGVHFGNIAGPEQNVSVFWLFDFGNAGANGVTLVNTQGFSNAQLYKVNSPVPEPATWALLIVALGGIGGVMRMRRKQARLAHAAA